MKKMLEQQLAIYTRDNCQYCSKLKMILDSFDVQYIHFKLDDDFTREEFYQWFGEGSTFPRVTLDSKLIGGCNETIEYLTSIGCLQEDKDMECTV